jgi:radical SAM family uncharacterized protein/radical SAM-linked protein
MTLADRIDTVLPLVAKPTRYLGTEFHVVRKSPEKDTVQWCLILPEVYEIGMSHWGLKILYDILNRRPDALAERCYAPWFDMEAQMRRHEIPLFSLESKRPVRDFDLVGFSLQYELTYTNLLNCLDLAGIPLRAEDRGRADPLVIAGGPCASNPEPLSDFIDLYLIGDGEEAVHAITEMYKEVRGRSRQEVLLAMARVPGVYVPLLYEAVYRPDGTLQGTRPRFDGVPARVERQFIRELETAPWPERPIVPLQGIVQDRLSVEVLRGCTQGCRFCQAGYLYRPVRERSVEKILEIADTGIRNSGWDEVGLVSLSTADYTQLMPLADVLNARFSGDRVAISLPSLRADSFGVGIADRVRETKKTGFTFAPEAGSERLRLAMNKIIRDEEFFAAARVAYERGWRLIKMYFMVGLPTETWDDVEGIARFVDTIRRIGREHGPSCSVNASVGAFVPKSHTPFQWDAFEDTGLLREKLTWLKRTVSSKWTRLKWHSVETSHLEAVFSLGDRRLGRAIENAFRRGARFDGWTEHFKYRLWLEAMQDAGVDPAFHTRARSFDETLPWDHIDIGVLKKWLVRERKKTDAQQFEIGKSLVADCRHGDCTACGIPGLPNDTMLTQPLTEDSLRGVMDRARSSAVRRDDTGVTWTARLRFEKRDLARFISHLETVDLIARAFRMARIPLVHSQGHHPHPKLSFGPPLPVGIEGLAELFDAELQEPWSERLASRLNEVLPAGMRVLEGRNLSRIPGTRRTSLCALARRGLYVLEFAGAAAETRARIRETVRSFDEYESCLVERTSWTPASSREVFDWEGPAEAEEAAVSTSEAPARVGTAIGETGVTEVTAGVTRVMVGASEVTPGGSGAGETRGWTRRDPRGKPGRSGAGAPHGEVRRVDLKQAVVAMKLCGLDASAPANANGDPARRYRLDQQAEACTSLEFDLYLIHPDGQVANPRVILEKLFRVGPEEQARIRVVRTALLDGSGERIGVE